MFLRAGEADVEEAPLLGHAARVECLVEGQLALLEPGQEDRLELESLGQVVVISRTALRGCSPSNRSRRWATNSRTLRAPSSNSWARSSRRARSRCRVSSAGVSSFGSGSAMNCA